MSKNAIKSLTLQGVLIAALGASGASGSITDDPKVAAAIDKIASAAGLLLATFGRLRKKDLHVKAAKADAPKAAGPTVPLLLFLVGTLALTGCGTIRALAGPNPGLVEAKPTIDKALDERSAAKPETKPENDKAKAAIADSTTPGLPEPPKDPTSPTDWLLWGLASITAAFTGGKTINRKLKARKAKKAGASATAPPQ